MQDQALQRPLNSWQVFAMAVGMVISGQYFGWNYAFLHASLLTVICALIFVSLFYSLFMSFFFAPGFGYAICRRGDDLFAKNRRI